MRREDIHVSLDNGVMTVYGERKPLEEGSILRSERVYGQFVRSFALPDTVDPSRIEASYENGVLNVRLPKTASAQPRQIEIRTG
jgi:HSP20 family protein